MSHIPMPLMRPHPLMAHLASDPNWAMHIVAGLVVGVLIIGLLMVTYLLPTTIAACRKRPNAGGIFALNLFLGWTLLGWVLAFVWACTTPGFAIDGSCRGGIEPGV